MAFYKSRVVRIGDLLLGGDHPIRIQSMTNTDTMDTVATVNQAIRMIDAGSEMVRITAQGLREAENLANIKRLLHERGFRTPLIADIHFNPKAAETAAAIVEKVRINPGNYTGSTAKADRTIEYSDREYNDELELIRSNLKPLISICKDYGTAIRIGVNHGSLGSRILGRYGDTIEGMVASALEYARIFESLDFHDLVISVKSSNTVMMLNAYRQLAAQLQHEHLNFPLHIGVTEAGEGNEGRMKSIAGIGAVLAHGIGDTIRVSLTEDPELELPVANAIVKRFSRIENNQFVERRIRKDIVLTPHPVAPHPQPFTPHP
ncbi:MAG TPA: (E)-4-hydroxy-3-methylbut-2-enyl-diphosphate synthase, partial [Lentimicrobium sp.]|nr:(E)-4-hydroxy-3-methylbut-2-enyl-diphosphate synthase [Lentimicrobium sp.]